MLRPQMTCQTTIYVVCATNIVGEGDREVDPDFPRTRQEYVGGSCAMHSYFGTYV